MGGKDCLTPDHPISCVRALHRDFCPDPSLCPGYGGSGGKLSIITSYGGSRVSIVPVLDVKLIPLAKLLGREYYQTPFGEKYLVLAPLVIHPLAGVAKRLFSLGIGSREPRSRSRPMTSALASTGYLTLFLFLPIHYLTNRVYPTISAAPIHSFGPAELDYEFVKTGLQAWPFRSWFLYIGLVGCVALHSVEGASIITATKFGKAIVPKSKRKLAALLASIPALTGLFFISREAVWALTSSLEGFVAAFSESMVYRIP